MRDTFVHSLYDAAREDRNIVLITGDLGFGAFDEFSATFKTQFVNAGVAA